jgi:hypothetical protein
MKKQIMKPFRAPRSTVEMRQATVHRKDNSARFKEMEKWMDKNVTGEGAKTSPVQKSKTRRSPRGQGNQDKEVHAIPYKKGIKLMSQREANECAEHGEVLRWSTDSGEDEYPQVTVETCDKAASDSEEPTEFGVVWERFVIRETQDVLGLPSSGGLEITTRNDDSVGIRSVTATSPSSVTTNTAADESPILSEYESDGFLSRRKTLSKRAQAKLGIFKRAKKLPPRKEHNGSDGEEDDVPLISLLNKATSNDVSVALPDVSLVHGSDGEEDDVPLVSLLNKSTSSVVTGIPLAVVRPTGNACIGVHIARDFGGEHGVCQGTIVSVDVHRRRPLYHVMYDDGDEEDFDEKELQYALELHEAHKNGRPFTTQTIIDEGTFTRMSLVILQVNVSYLSFL